MKRTPRYPDSTARQRREQTHLEISQRLIEELGDEADDHCLTITFHLVRAGCRADGRTLVRFASRAAEIAFNHRSYYLAGRYFEAAAGAAVRAASTHT